MKKAPLSYLISACLFVSVGAAQASSTAGLWSGAAELAPESVKVQTNEMNEGSFRYVPMHPVYFNHNKATLTHEGQQALDAAVEYLEQQGNIKRILIEGHTDWVGSQGYNYDLADRRTEIVRNYLTIKGIDPQIMAITSQGETSPVDINWSREGRRRNRHVSIYAVQWER